MNNKYKEAIQSLIKTTEVFDKLDSQHQDNILISPAIQKNLMYKKYGVILYDKDMPDFTKKVINRLIKPIDAYFYYFNKVNILDTPIFRIIFRKQLEMSKNSAAVILSMLYLVTNGQIYYITDNNHLFLLSKRNNIPTEIAEELSYAIYISNSKSVDYIANE